MKMSVPLNIIEFAIDLWENYLIYNLDELWSRCQNIILKPYPSIKEAYLKILALLSKQISIIYSPKKFQVFITYSPEGTNEGITKEMI